MNPQTDFLPIRTERLVLRRWREADREPFAAMCGDPRVMEFLTPLPTRAESDAYIDRLIAHQQQNGFCFWVMEDRATGQFAGATGLMNVRIEAHFAPAIEIGWRMPAAFWGKGLVTEAARACLDIGFRIFSPPEIVAYACERNHRSPSVMRRLGMVSDPADTFIHPNIPADHPNQPFVVYRIAAPEFLSR